MSYGYRLRVEVIFWDKAQDSFTEAENLSSIISHDDPMTAESADFVGFKEPEAMAAACLASICYAASVEAAVNYAWIEVVAPKIPIRSMRKRLLRTSDINEKLLNIWEAKAEETGLRKKSPINIREVKSLFEMRNRLMHFKDHISWQGFSYASEMEMDLDLAKLRSFRKSALEVLSFVQAVADFEYSDIDEPESSRDYINRYE